MYVPFLGDYFFSFLFDVSTPGTVALQASLIDQQAALASHYSHSATLFQVQYCSHFSFNTCHMNVLLNILTKTWSRPRVPITCLYRLGASFAARSSRMQNAVVKHKEITGAEPQSAVLADA